MRCYEIVLMIHPDQGEQVSAMIERYKGTVTARGGKIDRVEEWGRRSLAYMVGKNITKAYYVCINIQCDQQTVVELEEAFKFNDAILRYLMSKTEKPETEPSVMIRQVQQAEEAAKQRPATVPHG